MSDDTDVIWADDKLGRREEAEGLEQFLVNETRQLIEAGFDHAYVLGVDNPYGMGKSWFLGHLRKHLLHHGYPVAMVDAWADDSGNEPLVALMAAVDEAIQPHKRCKAIEEGLARTLKSVGTILIKGVTGFGAKQVGKLIGDDTLKGIGKDWQRLAKDAAADGGEDAVKAMGDLANDYAKAAIDGYVSRKNSVFEFKKNLRNLAEELSGNEPKPIFIIIDELDRCRPTYAIKLLEEVKHLFDVKGLVFVIALHGDQLAHSVKAVYGEGFEARDYLRRFFTLNYRMKEPSFMGISDYYFSRLKLPEAKMVVPSICGDGGCSQKPPYMVLGFLFEAMDISLRTAISIMNGLRVFCNQWRYEFPFELVTVTYLIAIQVTGRQDDPTPHHIFKDWQSPEINMACEGMEGSSEYYFNSINIITLVNRIEKSGHGLLKIASGRSDLFVNGNNRVGLNSYILKIIESELKFSRAKACKFQAPIESAHSVMSEYRNIVRQISRFIGDDEKAS